MCQAESHRKWINESKSRETLRLILPPPPLLHSPPVVCMLVAVQRWHQRRWSHSDECFAQWPLQALGPSGRRDTQLSTACPHTHNQSNMTQYGVGIVPLSHSQ